MSAVLDLKSERVRERDVCGIRYRAKATQRPSLLLLFDTPNLIITRKRERSGRLMFRGIVPGRVVPVFAPLPSSSSSLIPSLLHLLEFHRERITLHPRLHTHNSHSSSGSSNQSFQSFIRIHEQDDEEGGREEDEEDRRERRECSSHCSCWRWHFCDRECCRRSRKRAGHCECHTGHGGRLRRRANDDRLFLLRGRRCGHFTGQRGCLADGCSCSNPVYDFSRPRERRRSIQTSGQTDT